MKRTFQNMLFPTLLLMATGTQAQIKIITTICGNGTAAYGGDAAVATAAKLNNPSGVALGDSGKLYIVDKGNSRIRKINKAGIISTFAGTGTSGYSGDNGQATAAQMAPSAIAVDDAGNIYIAEGSNNCVRKITRLGVITTIAGTSTAGFMGDNGPASSAALSNPIALATDHAGSLYISDQGNNRIRIINSAGVIATVAGGGTGGLGDGGQATASTLSVPAGIALDRAGNLFIADQSNNVIRKVSITGIISTFAGTGISGYSGDGGPAIAAKFNFPVNVGVDSSNNVYVVEGNNSAIRKIDASGTITTIAGNGTSGFSGDGGPATAAKVNYPSAVAFDTLGNMFFADLNNNRVRKVGPISRVAVTPVSRESGSIELMPNPTTGSLTVKGTFNLLNDDNALMQVIDMTGKTVFSSTAQTHTGKLNTLLQLTDIPAGMYLLHVMCGDEKQVSVFRIQK
jgi:hypothetical protein